MRCGQGWVKFLLARDVYKTSKLTLGPGSPHKSRSRILDSDNVFSRKGTVWKSKEKRLLLPPKESGRTSRGGRDEYKPTSASQI